MEIINEISARMKLAELRYGPFASTHEAMGVALEEWDELREAIRSNDIEAIEYEALDLASVLVRMATACRENEGFKNRSGK